MSALPPLGGFDPKIAGAYLLPPATGMKKKTKKKPVEADKEKMASFFEAIVTKETENMQAHFSGFDFTAGWNK
jgi:hypothetical protein